MLTSLQGIAKKAQSQQRYRFRNMYGMRNEELLRESWREIKKHAAYGVDQISAQAYEQNLEGNIRDLGERLKQKRYRAKLIKRHYIPKGKGQLRPLGIPAVEDKLLQVAATPLLEAMYEQDFLPCSYGYGPGVGALDAVDKLTVKLQVGRYHYVVEADIKGFFDTMDHEWLGRMLAERIRAEQAALETRGIADGERKTITALFADLKGSTALIEGLDPEEARAIIDPALQLMMDAVHRYDGYVAQALGDGIFALFGAPIAHEDHPQRALYAALRMQEQIRRYSDHVRLKHGAPLSMRIGVNTGEVVVRSIRKDDLHTDYVPVGHST